MYSCTTFRSYHLLRIVSFRYGFWCVHFFQLLKVHNQYVSFPNSPRMQDIVEEYSRKYFLSKFMDSRLVFRGNRMIFNQGTRWKDWFLEWFFNACVPRTPHQHIRLAIEAHAGATTFPPTGAFLLFSPRVFRGPNRFSQPPFSVTTITDGYAREQFPWLLRGPDWTLSRLLLLELRPAGDPVDSDSSWRRSPPWIERKPSIR